MPSTFWPQKTGGSRSKHSSAEQACSIAARVGGREHDREPVNKTLQGYLGGLRARACYETLHG